MADAHLNAHKLLLHYMDELFSCVETGILGESQGAQQQLVAHLAIRPIHYHRHMTNGHLIPIPRLYLQPTTTTTSYLSFYLFRPLQMES